MSQYGGEASSSNATRSSDDSQGLSDEQRRTIEKCTSIVQEFRAGHLSKSKAALLLQQAIPHDDPDDEVFLSTYESYFDMLKNFERYRDGNVRRVDEVQQQLAGTPAVEQDSPGEQPDQIILTGALKRQRSSSADNKDDEYVKQTRLDFDTLPWNETESPNLGISSSLSPALQKTQSLLENFSHDVKRARSSLLNCNKSIPQFPQAEWLNLLSENAVDLDHVFSNLYTVSHSTNDVIELGKNIELLHGSSVPAKNVRTHGDWVIALYSSTGGKNCNPMVNTSNIISPHYPLSSTVESSTMIELSELEQLNDEMLNS